MAHKVKGLRFSRLETTMEMKEMEKPETSPIAWIQRYRIIKWRLQHVYRILLLGKKYDK